MTPLRTPTPKQVCSVEWCERPARSAGLCSSHYVRRWKGQDLNVPFRVTEPRGLSLERNANGEKRCRVCRRWLPLSSFAKHPRTSDGLRAHCRSCGITLQRLYKYGLTAAEYDAMFEAQGRVCAICGTDDPGRSFCIDHDHSCCPGDKSCGKCIRGIICDPCNTGLGRFRDSADLLRKAADYLEQEPAA